VTPESVSISGGKGELSVRPAHPDDGLDLLYWRNDPHVRAMSRNSDVLKEADHLAWYEQALHSVDMILLIGEQESRKVGMVRFDQRGTFLWEANILLEIGSRGKGVSRLLLGKALAFFYERHAHASVVASIKPENEASLRLFRSLGFVFLNEEEGMVSYRLEASPL